MNLPNHWVVIFAGGTGTRLGSSEEIPKPLVLVHSEPLLWELILLYRKAGLKRFLICLGFGAKAIQKFFIQKFLDTAIVSEEQENNSVKIFIPETEETFVLQDTGINTQTAGRLKQVLKKIDSDNFFLNYADGLSTVNISEMYEHHCKTNNKITLLTVQPTIQYGILNINQQNLVANFIEKPKAPYWINAGFFIINKETLLPFINTCNNDDSFEVDVLPKMAQANLVGAYKHNGFWMSVDTQKDLLTLREKWKA